MFKTLKTQDMSYGVNTENINYIKETSAIARRVIIYFKNKRGLEIVMNSNFDKFMKDMNSDESSIRVQYIQEIGE